ncbi:MAG TPA: DUF2336 domain-containing protein [Stellaceae bacterium]|nr:DUF2336 domain-containing protein [Stellaceae bacterium]
MVLQFAQEHSWTERAKTVERAATLYVDGALDPDARMAALDLFRLALYDGEPLVRRVLAESIKHARELPRDIVRTLASDAPEVSAPFLASSPLIADEDLLAIAQGGVSAQRAAIARRLTLPSRVARILFGQPAVA